MNRTYMPMIDNGLFVAEYYLGKPYTEITIDDLFNNTELFASKIADLIETTEFYRKIVYSTHMNSSFTQTSKKKSKDTMIAEQFKFLLESVGHDKNCIYCGKEQVNLELNIDRKFMYGLISQTFYNSANNLQTVDICPICAYLSMISILNIQKIGMPTLYISDSDDLMRSITKNAQELITDKHNLDDKINIDSKLKASRLVELCLDNSNITIGYVTQFCFQNAGQMVNDIERTLYRKDIGFLNKLKTEELLDEFMSLGFHNRLALNLPIRISDISISPRLFKILEDFELKEEEKNIVEYATKALLEIEDVERILKELKLCSSKARFNNFILNYSEKRALVQDVKHYDVLTGYAWIKFRDYINVNVLIHKNNFEREEQTNE